MSYRNFLEEVRKGLPAGNYLLSSEDRFLQTEAVSVVRNLVPASEADFNYHVFDLIPVEGEKLQLEQVLDVLVLCGVAIGALLASLGWFIRAGAALTRRTNPWFNLGVFYKLSGQISRVLEVYKRLKTLDPAKADQFFTKVVLP